ncbi:hypothetical protein V9T40_002020 [Parthenolecanium corni]|uniref:Double jelly roll-like domain-containing protein n=1 Tax=Parthenolecanium corni TaxID=536013 RepID=A0AAN9Y3K2_9HEMI
MSIQLTSLGLNLHDKIEFQDYITDVKFIHHFPHSYCSYNYNDEITISVDQKNVYTFPHNSFICIKGAFTNPGNAFLIGFNGLIYLFKEISYSINGTEIERTSNPGVATAIRRILLMTPQNQNYYDSYGFSNETSHCYPNIDIVSDANGQYHFYVEIPLHIFFSYAEDYRKLLINARQEIKFRRDINDKNVFKVINENENREAVLTIESIDWKLPYVELADILKNYYLKTLKNDTSITIPFRKWELFENLSLPQYKSCTWNLKMVNNTDRILWFALAFHTNKRYNYKESMKNFQVINVKNVKIFLNSKYYPYDSQNAESWHYDAFYQEICQFQHLYNSQNLSIAAAPFATKEYFDSQFPIFLVNLSYRDTSVKTGVSDLKVYFETGTNIPPNTVAYGMLIYETIYQYTPLSEMTTQII